MRNKLDTAKLDAAAAAHDAAYAAADAQKLAACCAADAAHDAVWDAYYKKIGIGQAHYLLQRGYNGA